MMFNDARESDPMKSILLYTDHGEAFESRFQAALDLARSQGGHLTFVQVTPFSAFVVMDPMGGSYVPAGTLERLRGEEATLRSKIEERMRGEDVPWDFTQFDGDPVESMVSASRLADVIVLSLGSKEAGVRPHPLLPIGSLATEARCPVLAVPADAKGLSGTGTIMVAWDGSHESANALRAALPLLRGAEAVHLVTVEEKETAFPSTEASEYLSRHGVSSELHVRPRGSRSIEEALEQAATELKADLLVMGAYGHSRLRETLLGGVTKYFLDDAAVPLLLAH